MIKRSQVGFTLIEVMIVVVIIGILASIAYPSYQQYVLRSNRTEGIAMLNDAAARQERYFAQNNTYADTVAKIGMNASSANSLYDLSISNASATAYTLTATAKGVQLKDTKCKNLGLNQAGTKTTTGTSSAAECWK